MKRELPVYTIEGTDFLVDVEKLQIRENGNPENTISILDDMRDVGDSYVFDYNSKEKNIPGFLSDDKDITVIKMPELVTLDPMGMCEKYGYRLEDITHKTDFDLMVDQSALQQRLMGRLTTVDIAGHTFYVDIPMDMLRPKDDFLSNGIVFREIDHYYDEDKGAYIIPYNPQTHEFQELDYDGIIALPKELIAIQIPHESVLDPIGINRKVGLDEMNDLKRTNIRSHFEAGIVDWKDIGIE